MNLLLFMSSELIMPRILELSHSYKVCMTGQEKGNLLIHCLTEVTSLTCLPVL